MVDDVWIYPHQILISGYKVREEPDDVQPNFLGAAFGKLDTFMVGRQMTSMKLDNLLIYEGNAGGRPIRRNWVCGLPKGGDPKDCSYLYAEPKDRRMYCIYSSSLSDGMKPEVRRRAS